MTTRLVNGNVENTQNQQNKQEFAFTTKWLQENTMPIHGWLKFFLILVTYGCGLNLGIAIASPLDNPNFPWIANLPSVVLFAEYFILIFYMGWQFTARKPNAVFLAKVCSTILFAITIISLAVGLYLLVKKELVTPIWQLIVSTAYNATLSVAFYIYLIHSEQVEELIPKSYRKVKVFEWVIVGLIVLLPIVAFVVATVLT